MGVKKENGKHKKQNSKLRAENHKTHDRLNLKFRGPQNEVLSDVKPRTENAEHTTDPPSGPVLLFWLPVLGLQFPVFTTEKLGLGVAVFLLFLVECF